MELRTVLPILLLFILILSGIWTRKGGRPLISLRFTVHKLSAIALTVLIIVSFWKGEHLPDYGDYSIWVQWIHLVLLSLSFVSGALLSFDKFAVRMLQLTHKKSSILFTLSIAVTAYLFYFSHS